MGPAAPNPSTHQPESVRVWGSGGLQGALNRWLLVSNVQLAALGTPPTDPVLPDVLDHPTIAPAEPALLAELRASGLSAAAAGEVCLRLSRQASAAARSVAEFRASSGCAAAMSAGDDSTTGVCALHEGAETILTFRPSARQPHSVPPPEPEAKPEPEGRVGEAAEGRSFRIHRSHFDKLRRLYTTHAADWPRRLFHTRLFCLVARYSFYLNSRNQGACPAAFFRCVEAQLGVSTECFASPFNNTLSSFYSVSPSALSSNGSHRRALLTTVTVTVHVTGAACVVRRPSRTARLASARPAPSSRALIRGKAPSRPTRRSAKRRWRRWPSGSRPCWRIRSADPYPSSSSCPPVSVPPAYSASLVLTVLLAAGTDSAAFATMDGSRFKRRLLTLDKQAHSFVEGDQHLASTRNRHWSAQHRTSCFVLQNALGAARWPATDGVADAMLRAFRDRRA